MVGLFPSNFVEVLPDDFRPVSRSVSPLPQQTNTPPQSQPAKSKTFRKPFEAYAKAPHYSTAKTPEIIRDSPVRAREPSREPSRVRETSTVRDVSRIRESSTVRDTSRVRDSSRVRDHSRVRDTFNRDSVTPVPYTPSHSHNLGVQEDRGSIRTPRRGVQEAIGRIRTPLSYGQGSRQPSPAPSFNSQLPQQYPPQFDGEDDDAPPPPPPPHRHVGVSRHGSSLSYDSQIMPRPPGDVSRHGSHLSYDSRIVNDVSRHGSHASYDSRIPNDLGRHGSHASYDSRMQPELTRHSSRGSFDDRHEYEPYRPPETAQNPRSGYHTPRAQSPNPSTAGSGMNMTPSPLREAMDGVMEQLDALGVSREPDPEPESPEAPLDIWSPESFDLVNRKSRRQRDKSARPQTSMALTHGDSGYGTGSGTSSQDHTNSGSYSHDGRPPELGSYVQRMESRLQDMHAHNNVSMADEDEAEDDQAPPPPLKGRAFERPKSSMDTRADGSDRRLRNKRSTYDVGKMLGRTFTTKTNSTSASSKTNSSSATQSTNRSLMSGVSAGGISATSAGSMARKNRDRAQSALGIHDLGLDRPETPFTGVSYHSSHASETFLRPKSQTGFADDPMGNLGGLASPSPKKRNFFKKLMDTAKTGVATGRSNIAISGTSSLQSMQALQASPMPLNMSDGANAMSSTSAFSSSMGPGNPVREMGLGAGTDWVQVRRDVNRSNTLSRNERNERRDRCLMLDYPALDPVDELYGSIEGDEGIDGLPIRNPTDYQVINFMNVDKNSRFLKSLPPMTTAITLATTYVCRPYRSDVQRLRAIYTWVAELICWEEDIEGIGKVDTRRVIQQKRACAEEYAVLVMEMCGAVGLHCEVVRGYLKTPGEIPETNMLPRPNHWWNAVLVDGEWRMMDCCLGSPSNPKRALYSCVGSGSADFWYFLTRPSELCWTHMPEHHEQQHVCPPVAHETLLNLPCACPPYFINDLNMVDYNTSLTRIEDLEMVHVKFNVPADVEIAAEVETRALSRDSDGDFFESGDMVKKRALAQCEWFNGTKRYTVKALLPGDEGHGTLKVYAGKRGLMHSIKDIPHPMAFAIPIIHTGENPAYEFVTRHPTPHAQRHDIYVVQPQCQRLALNNTFVFAIRQHPSSFEPETPTAHPGSASPIPFARPGSAMSISASSNPSSYSGSGGTKKPAKLAIQTPGGKILRLMRKEDRSRGIGVGSSARGVGSDEETSDGGTWETIIKCSEKGVWRGLVLADRIAKWCVFAEWHCVG